MSNNDKFLAPKGDYKKLIAFQKTESIYNITHYFVEHYLPKIGDRTVDQMVQAARSGKQNIAEGNETGTTSMEACIKLVNVAKASLKGLQEDYDDYLRNHGNQKWDVRSQQCMNARKWCKEHSSPTDYIRVCQLRDDNSFAIKDLSNSHHEDTFKEYNKTMNEYIFYTKEGHTIAPNENIEVENCQVLGCAFGNNKYEAQEKLLKDNPWINEAGFSTSEFFVKQLMTT